MFAGKRTYAHTFTDIQQLRVTRALVMYYTPILYCVYALVGGAISIRDPYICAVHQSVPTNHTLSSTGLLSVQ